MLRLYTGFASIKNRWINHLVRRRDMELIPPEKITDYYLLMIFQRLFRVSSINNLFDILVSVDMMRHKKAKAIIVWSGMAERTLIKAKRNGIFTVLARASSHLTLQNELLTRGYGNVGIEYRIDQRITNNEPREYELTDKLYVCSSFAKKSFIERGYDEKKIFVSYVGLHSNFKRDVNKKKSFYGKLRIVFLGKMTIKKGINFLFEALLSLAIPESDYEMCFIGGGEKWLIDKMYSYKKHNWSYLGQVQQNHLPSLLSEFHLGVFSSIEDGFAQVVPQQMACGVPVIVTENTGSSDLVDDKVSGFVVPAFDARPIKEKIEFLYHNRSRLEQMAFAAETAAQNFPDRDEIAYRFIEMFKAEGAL